MATCLKLFIAILVLSFVQKGLCQIQKDCNTLDNLNVGQVRSGREIQGKTEWTVTVTNNCKCNRSAITLSCKGFQTVEKIDLSVLIQSADGRCLLIGGNPLPPSASINFSYAWDPPFLLRPVNAAVAC